MDFDEFGRHVGYVPVDDDWVTVIETFDVKNPRCLLVVNPWASESLKGQVSRCETISYRYRIPKYMVP